MSYKTHKRRVQRLKVRTKLAFWQEIREKNKKISYGAFLKRYFQKYLDDQES